MQGRRSYRVKEAKRGRSYQASEASVWRRPAFIHAVTAKVQGAVVAEAEEIVGLRRGTAVTRAQS